MHVDADIPDYLLEAPSGTLPAPPVTTAEPLLPFGDLAWENFERLCLRLARLEGKPERVQLFGVRGQGQSGIDIYSRQSDDTYATYQCKREEDFDDGDIRTAVATFLSGEWAETSSRFVLCTSHSAVRTERAREVEVQARTLRERGTAFDVWDAEELSLKLKDLPELVEEFFGRPWLERFLPAHAQRELAAELGGIREQLIEIRSRSFERVRVITLDWAPARLKHALEEFHRSDPDRFANLIEQVGNPPTAERVVACIAAPPPWLLDANSTVWTLMARLAESLGEWPSSSAAWFGASERQADDYDRARSFLSAAAAETLSGHAVRHDEYIERARVVAPEHVQLALLDVSDQAPGEEQLHGLEGLAASHPDDVTLLAARRAIATLLVGDVSGARAQLRIVEQDGAGSLLARGIGVSIKVQEGRLALLAGMPLDAPGLRSAQADALDVRDQLLRERRPEESARLLMLAADAACLLGERSEASELLGRADASELSAPTGPVVLADAAASRAFDHHLALRLLGEDDSPSGRRLRADCLLEVGGPEERAEALKELDNIVEGGTDDAAEAALIRLAASLGPHEATWSETAARFLREHGFERQAVVLEAWYVGHSQGDYERAYTLLDSYRGELWAKLHRLRVSALWGNDDVIREAASDLLSSGPSQAGRFEAGRAYGKAGDYARAQEVLIGVARDASGPPSVRADAYDLLMHVAGKGRGDWALCRDLQAEWASLTPRDTRASQWLPTIANRVSHER